MSFRSLLPGRWHEIGLWTLVVALFGPVSAVAQVSPFSFAPQTGVAPNTLVTSNQVQVSSTAASSSISIVGGEYSIGGGAFTSAAGSVASCQTVRVRVLSSATPGATTSATLNIGGVTGTFSVTTAAADTVPNAFNFSTQSGVPLSTATLSNSITVSGTNAGSAISVAGGEYRINNGAFTSAGGTVNPGDTVALRVTSAATYATTTQATLTIGGVSGTFAVTTLAEPVSGLTFAPTTLNFVQPGLGSPSTPQTVTVTNSSSTPVAIGTTSLGGAAASDFNRNTNCGGSLAAGASCTVAVTFTPSAPGVRAAEISLTTNPSTPDRIGLIGNRNAGLFSDVNGDGKSDILWRHSSAGYVVVWPMNGVSVTGGALVSTADVNWQMVGAGDFNADGKSDLLWWNPATRDVIVWRMDGSTAQAGTLVNRTPRGFQIVGTGDFNGDGSADILLRNDASGANTVWLMNGVTRQATVSLLNADPGWQIAGTGDFDGDGKSDILWRHNAAGHVVAWLMNGGTLHGGDLVNTVDLGWQIAGIGDFNGDGKSDILWRHNAAGHMVVWLMNGTTLRGAGMVATVPDPAWIVEGTGDYNGDGKSDILWRNRVWGNGQVWFMNGATLSGAGNLPTVSETGWEIVP